jgi:hypothetical protein
MGKTEQFVARMARTKRVGQQDEHVKVFHDLQDAQARAAHEAWLKEREEWARAAKGRE